MANTPSVPSRARTSCPRCGRVFTPPLTVCPDDGERLVAFVDAATAPAAGLGSRPRLPLSPGPRPLAPASATPTPGATPLEMPDEPVSEVTIQEPEDFRQQMARMRELFWLEGRIGPRRQAAAQEGPAAKPAVPPAASAPAAAVPVVIEEPAEGRPRDPLLGRRVGNYRVEKLIAEGGMGRVYLGVHETLERWVAIKTINPELTQDPAAVGRFVDEARAVARIGHPGLVEVLDSGTLASGRPYTVLEYLEGEDLAHRLKRGPVPPAEVAEIGLQVSDALAATHARGFIHRDLKPGNIFLCSRPGGGLLVKVLDFGIAKLIGPQRGSEARTQVGAIIGTPAYVSPEQALAKPDIDGRSDIYSLGIVLYEAASGRPPFEFHDFAQVLRAHCLEPPRPLAEVAPEMPAALAEAIDRCLQKSPGERFQSMLDLHRALKKARAPGPAAARGNRPAGPPRRQSAGTDADDEATAIAPPPADPAFAQAASPAFGAEGSPAAEVSWPARSKAASAPAADRRAATAMIPPPRRGLQLGGALVAALVAGGLVWAALWAYPRLSSPGSSGSAGGSKAPGSEPVVGGVAGAGPSAEPAAKAGLRRPRPRNPYAADDPAVLAAGAAIYSAQCATCHGARGEGDGQGTPPGFEPRLVAGAASAPGLLDVYRYEIVRVGVVKNGRSTMPGFGQKLSVDDTWKVVSFVGTLAAAAGSSGAQAAAAAGPVTPAAAGSGLASGGEPVVDGPKPPLDRAMATRGARLYARLCASCHGRSGRGDGPAQEYLERAPADLTRGPYKFRSTPKGALPLDEDLFETLTRGTGPGGMPSFHKLSFGDRWALVAHVEALNPRFAAEPRAELLAIPPRPRPSGAAVERGHALYRSAGCPSCHGEGGRGDGPRARGLTDDAGRPARPADLTSPFFRGGSRPEQIYRTVMTGLDGTPMPGARDRLNLAQAWDLVEYLLAIRLVAAPGGRWP